MALMRPIKIATVVELSSQEIVRPLHTENQCSSVLYTSSDVFAVMPVSIISTVLSRW